MAVGDDDGVAPAYEIEDTDISGRPDIAMDKEEAGRLVREIVDRLPAEQRLVAIMYYFQEISVKDIAQEIGCSENTIKSRLRYARMTIEREVKELEERGTILRGFVPIPFFIEGLHFGSDSFALSAQTASQLFTSISGKLGEASATLGRTAAATGTKTGADATTVATTGAAINIKAIILIVVLVIAIVGGCILIYNQVRTNSDVSNIHVENENAELENPPIIDPAEEFMEEESEEIVTPEPELTGNERLFGFDPEALLFGKTYGEINENYPDFLPVFQGWKILASEERGIQLSFNFKSDISEDLAEVFESKAKAKVVFPKMEEQITIEEIEQIAGMKPENPEKNVFIFRYGDYSFSYFADVDEDGVLIMSIFPETSVWVRLADIIVESSGTGPVN